MSTSVPQYYFGCVDRDQNREIYASYVKEILHLAAPALGKPLKECRVLDVGSGNGGVALELGPHVASVTGLEIVPALHERAVEKARERGVRNVEFVQGSVYQLPWKGEFDLILFLTAIEHLADHQKALANIVGALKEVGVFYMTAPNRLWPFEQHYGLPLLHWLPLPLANRYVRAFNKAESFEDASYSLSYFGTRRLLNRFPLNYKFCTPHNVEAKVYGCGTAKGKGIYRFGKWLLDRFPIFWVISKGFIVVAQKKSAVSQWSGKSVAVATYTHRKDGKATYVAGPSQDLKRYLAERAGRLLFIEQPVSFSDDLAATAELFIDGKKVKTLRFPMFPLPKKMRRPDIDNKVFAYILFKLRDIFSTFYFFLRFPKKVDCFVGVESVNAILGMALRFFRRVRRVVYDVIDYSPRRFPNPKLNRIFHSFDRFCARRADFSWAQTPLVIEERKKSGVPVERQLVKPTGVDSGKMGALPLSQIQKHQMIYVGGLYPVDGVELLIEALPAIRERIPDVKLVVIGYGTCFDSIAGRAQTLGVDRHVEMLGAVTDPDRVDELIRKSALGFAPYRDDPDSVKAFNDTAKPKLYLSLGAPVLMTQVTLFSQELERKQAGFALPYEVGAWAAAASRLLGDEALLESYRRNAIALAEKYRWENVFDRLFAQMGVVS